MDDVIRLLCFRVTIRALYFMLIFRAQNFMLTFRVLNSIYVDVPSLALTLRVLR